MRDHLFAHVDRGAPVQTEARLREHEDLQTARAGSTGLAGRFVEQEAPVEIRADSSSQLSELGVRADQRNGFGDLFARRLRLVGERLIGSTEVLESIIGKYKRFQSSHSKGGMSDMILSIGAMLGSQAAWTIKQGLEKVRSADVDTWCRENLGLTIAAQRKSLAPRATKTG